MAGNERKETMTDKSKCLKCGGTDLKAGKVSGAFFPVSVFRPEGGSLASYKNHAMPVKAAICLECGFVEISGDPEVAKAVLKRIETD